MKSRYIFFILIIIMIAGCGAAAADEQIRFGPCITSTAPDEVTIHYTLSEPAAGGVVYRAENSSGIFVPSPLNFTHAVSLKNLTPDTVYAYQVLIGDTRSPEYSFTTLGSQNYTAVITGDTRGEPPFSQMERHGVVAASVAAEHPLFVVHLGDFSGDGSDPEEWDEFFSAGKELYANTIIVPVQGNHDKGDIYSSLFCLPNWYSVTAGNLTCIVLNTNLWVNKYFENQTAWMSERFAGPGTKIALFHHPFYTTDEKMSGLSAEQRRVWQSLFAGNITAAYSAHMHAYERYESAGVMYVTNGCGGAPLYPPRASPELTPVSAVYFTLGYVRLTVSGDTFTSEFVPVAGVDEKTGVITRTFPAGTAADSFSSGKPVVSPLPVTGVIFGLCTGLFLRRKL